MKILKTFGIGQTPSQSTATFGQPSQQQTMLVTTNPRFPVNVIISNQGVRIVRGTISAGIAMADLIAAAQTLEPLLAPPPLITANPASLTVQYSAAASFSVTATSDTPETYQWQVSASGSSTWANLINGSGYSNVTTPTMGISDSSALNNYRYRCLVTNGSGVATSAGAILTVVDPGILTQPTNQTVATGNPTSFTVVAAGATALSYQWQMSNNSGATWTDLTDTGVYTNSLTATLNISDVTGLNGLQYRCVVSDANGVQNSTAATLTVT